MAGEDGAAAKESDAFREFAADDEADRKSKAGMFGSDGSRAVLMRRKPVSRSAVRMGDLFVADMHVSDCLMQAPCRQSCESPSLATLPRLPRGRRDVPDCQCLCPTTIVRTTIERTWSSHNRVQRPRSAALVATAHPP